MNQQPLTEWVKNIYSGDKRSLSKAITLIESRKSLDEPMKAQLLRSIQKLRKSSIRIGITGSPGVGKSAFINALVSLFKGSSYRIAVLTIDPSSTRTGGSILGDKLRMTDILDMDRVYIRPSPSKGELGGITLTTWETIQLCEAAQYDYIFVETVGVGQSEGDIHYLTNEVWYLTMAHTGDEIQNIKKGILEIVNRIIVTKADINPEEAQKTCSLLKRTLRNQSVIKKEITCYTGSSLYPPTLENLFKDLCELDPAPWTSSQIGYWFDQQWQQTLLHLIQDKEAIKILYNQLREEVLSGSTDQWGAMDNLRNLVNKAWKKQI